jgi:hypothetical protein
MTPVPRHKGPLGERVFLVETQDEDAGALRTAWRARAWGHGARGKQDERVRSAVRATILTWNSGRVLGHVVHAEVAEHRVSSGSTARPRSPRRMKRSVPSRTTGESLPALVFESSPDCGSDDPRPVRQQPQLRPDRQPGRDCLDRQSDSAPP